MQARAGMVAHLVPGRPELTARLGMIQSAFTARGLDAASAHEAARRVLDFAVLKQSTMLTFEKLFLLSGFCFLAVMPLLFLLKSATHDAPKVEVHVEM